MRRTFLAAIGLLAVGAVGAGLAACQAPAAGAAKTAGTATPGTPPRTAWGDPDLEGVWENLQRTPLERAKEFGTREFMTEQEAADRARKARSLNTSGTPTASLPDGEAGEVA